jgi:hypothetical protein
MPEISKESRKQRKLGGWKLILAVVMILAYASAATYGVMSDSSARGLTVKMFSISRNCPTVPSSYAKTLSYSISGSIWSTSSLPTSLTHLSFTLSVDGSLIGTATGSDSSFGSGKSTSFSISFTNPTLNPTTLPETSLLVLDLTATVASGLYSSTLSASDTTLQSFGSTGC